MAIYFVWGHGTAQNTTIQRADAADEHVPQAEAAAAYEDGWVAVVEMSEADIDAATRHDPAVLGYCRAEEPAS